MPLPVIFSPAADRHLKGLKRYLTKRYSETNATKFVQAVYDRRLRIALAPYQGTPREDLSPRLRTTGYDRTVTIAFRVDRNAIRIVSISYRGRSIFPDLNE